MIESIREEMKLLGTLMGILWLGTSTILSLPTLLVLPSNSIFSDDGLFVKIISFFFLAE